MTGFKSIFIQEEVLHSDDILGGLIVQRLGMHRQPKPPVKPVQHDISRYLSADSNTWSDACGSSSTGARRARHDHQLVLAFRIRGDGSAIGQGKVEARFENLQ
jgi:hypothetical protein